MIGSFTAFGDTLVYRMTGKGSPVLFIAGGGGDGDLFLPLADRLSSEYKVIVYDRRANAGSTINHPDCFSLHQQAEDAMAILDQAGEPAALIIGNSSGAVIGLEILRLFPERVRGLIAHEPPLAKEHPQKDKWIGFFRKCYDLSFGPGGPPLAASRFFFGIEVPAIPMIRAQLKAERYLKKNHISKEKKVTSRQASEYLIRQELLPVVLYEADHDCLRRERDKAVLAVGTYAKENGTFLYEAASQLSKKTGIPCESVPGHHGSFMDEPEQWAERVRQIIHKYFTQETSETGKEAGG